MIAAILAVVFAVLSVPVSAADSPAYNELAEQTPVWQRELTLAELQEYYMTADTDEILDPAQCNYTYGEVSVGGVAELCHVYMRTFVITDVEGMTIYDLEALAKRIVTFVKGSFATKYMKCIAKTYNARITKYVKDPYGEMDSVTVKIFIACGEKTEDRIALKQGYVAAIADELLPLSDGQRFLRLNELMLDGRFRYDITYRHRCSSVALVNDGCGVCEEYAGFTSLVLDALGYENYIITGEVGGMPHMWNLVCVNGRYYHLDILHNGPINAEGVHTSAERTYLLVSEKSVRQTHTIADAYIAQSSLCEYDFVFDGYPDSLPAQEINGVRYVFAPYTPVTSSEFAKELDAEEFLTISKNGSELLPNDPLCSGCRIELIVNGVLLDDCVLCRAADISGDGQIGADDVMLIAEYLISDDQDITDLFLLSADMDGNEAVTVTDLIIISDIVNGTYTGQNGELPGEDTEATV